MGKHGWHAGLTSSILKKDFSLTEREDEDRTMIGRPIEMLSTAGLSPEVMIRMAALILPSSIFNMATADARLWSLLAFLLVS